MEENKKEGMSEQLEETVDTVSGEEMHEDDGKCDRQDKKKIKKLEGKGHDLVLEAIEKAIREHGKCCENVIDTISLWYTKYGKDGRITSSEARRLNRMFELMEDIEYDLDQTTEEEKNHLDVLLAAILALYAKDLNMVFSLDLLKQVWAEDGIHYSDRIWDNKAKLMFYIRRDLKQAFARGDSLDEIAKQIRKRFKSSNNGLRNLFDSNVTSYEAIIMLEVAKSLAKSKYRWVTIKDGKQCDECDMMDGLIFNVSEFEVGVTAPQLHNHCRCQIIPTD